MKDTSNLNAIEEGGHYSSVDRFTAHLQEVFNHHVHEVVHFVVCGVHRSTTRLHSLLAATESQRKYRFTKLPHLRFRLVGQRWFGGACSGFALCDSVFELFWTSLALATAMER